MHPKAGQYAAKFLNEMDRVGTNPTDEALAAVFQNCVIKPPTSMYDDIRAHLTPDIIARKVAENEQERATMNDRDKDVLAAIVRDLAQLSDNLQDMPMDVIYDQLWYISEAAWRLAVRQGIEADKLVYREEGE